MRYVLIFCVAFSVSTVWADEKEDNPIFKPSLTALENPVSVADSEAATAAEMKPYTETIPGTEQKFKMVPISGGKLLMGGTQSEAITIRFENKDQTDIGVNTPKFEIEIEPFWMEEHETTWKEFSEYALKWLRNKNAQNQNDVDDRSQIADAMACPTGAWDISSISYNNSSKDLFPASGMTSYAAAAYCKWLTYKTGRYYRLPTEAEWEFACLAGATGDFAFGDDHDDLEDYGWYFDNCEEGYQRIKKKKPNAFGLYDMHGNVAEWVIAAYTHDSYEKLAQREFPATVVKWMKEVFAGERTESLLVGKFPVHPIVGTFGHVARGGSCDHEAAECSARIRLVSNPKWKGQDPQFPKSIWWMTDAPFVGFRVVRPLNPPQTDTEAALYEPDPTVWKEYSELNTRE